MDYLFLGGFVWLLAVIIGCMIALAPLFIWIHVAHMRKDQQQIGRILESLLTELRHQRPVTPPSEPTRCPACEKIIPERLLSQTEFACPHCNEIVQVQ